LWSWDDAFRVACGEHGLAPAEFEQFTYAELRVYLEGCHNRRKREYRDRHEQNAWLAATLINFTVPREEPITSGMLLGKKPRKVTPRKTLVESFDDSLAKTRRRVASVPSVNVFERAKRVKNGE
jgi:hypothetical protein